MQFRKQTMTTMKLSDILLTSLMKIYRGEFDAMPWNVLVPRAKGIRNRLTFSGFMLQNRAFVACIQHISKYFSSFLCGCRWRRKWRLEVFAFIYGLMLLAFRFLMLQYFLSFNSFSARLHAVFLLLHTSLKLFILIFVVLEFSLSLPRV